MSEVPLKGCVFRVHGFGNLRASATHAGVTPSPDSVSRCKVHQVPIGGDHTACTLLSGVIPFPTTESAPLWVVVWGGGMSLTPDTLHTAHCTIHLYTLHTTHHTLHTTHYTLHTTHYTLHTTHYTLHTTHYTLHTAHYTHHTTAPQQRSPRP